MTSYWKAIGTPLGEMILAATDGGLAGAWFSDQKHFPGVAPHWRHKEDHAVLLDAEEQLGAYFGGRLRAFSLPLAPQGTQFQHSVWAALAALPYGVTSCYGALAAQLGRPGAARAVGTATGRNPLTIIVPCHRLLGSDGSLHGYAGGLERKRALLALEAEAS